MANYLDHKALGIRKSTLGALVWTQKQLEKGRFTHNGDSHGNVFSMNQQCVLNYRHDDNDRMALCDTIACIGGWMAIHKLGIKPNAKGVYNVTSSCAVSDLMEQIASESKRLKELFYPSRLTSISWEDITPVMALRAIYSYRRTGNADWLRAIGE